MERKNIKILFVLVAILFTFTTVDAATKYKYTITYNLDYGTNCSNNPAGFNKNNKKIVLCEPTRKGYQFGGWYTDKAMTKQVATIKKNKNSNVTLYAKWIKNKYYVKYDANSGTGTMATSTFKYNTNYLLRANIFTKKGYTFVGWNTKKDGTGISYTDGQKIKSLTNKNGKTITLYAQWRKTIYYVQYHNNGGTGKIRTSTLKYGKTYNLPISTFTRKGYTFVGWNTKKDGSGISYTDGQEIKNLTNKDGKVITLYAQWDNRIIIRGTGDQVVTGVQIPEGAYRVRFDYDGAHNFIVKFYDSPTNKYYDLLANEIGVYHGESEIKDGKTYEVTDGILTVKASADWTVTFEPIEDEIYSSSVSGFGDNVIGWFKGTGNVQVFDFDYDGLHNFIVKLYSKSGYEKLLVNEIGSYHGQDVFKTVKNKDYYFVVISSEYYNISWK